LALPGRHRNLFDELALDREHLDPGVPGVCYPDVPIRTDHDPRRFDQLSLSRTEAAEGGDERAVPAEHLDPFVAGIRHEDALLGDGHSTRPEEEPGGV